MPRILVITDPDFSNEFILSRMREVPKENTVYRVEHYLSPTTAKDGSEFSKKLKDKQAWLKDLVAPLIAEGYQVEWEVHAYRRLFQTIIRSAKKFNADYVFKPLRQHSTLRKLLYSSTDWNLIRYCPCPLLLMSETSEIHGRPVLASLDLETRDEPHAKLNQVVLQQAGILSELLESKQHLVNAYNLMTVTAGDVVLDPLEYEIIKGRREEFFTKALELAAKNNISPDNVHLREGAPEMVVNQVAEEINAGVVVIGTVARSGISGMFIGNTAENVMEGTHCDIFVVKQSDFVSPVEDED